MAIFCTKCGTELPHNTQFCTNCGAPQPVTSQPAVPATQPMPYGQPEYQAPPASSPMYGQPYAQPGPPPTSGTSAVKVILIIVGVIVGLGILAVCIFAFTIWRVSKAVHVNGDGSNVTLSTPGGQMSVNTDKSYSASELGTDPYPGASKGHGGMNMDLPTGTMVSAIFWTADSKDKVLAFYKDKLGSDASTMDNADTAILSRKKGDGEAVVVTISPNKEDHGGQTQITILHTKKK